MTLLKIWIHFVFTAKNTGTPLPAEVRHELVKYLRTMTREHKIYLDHVCVLGDHFHCIVSLGKEQTIAQVAAAISGNTSGWLNDNSTSSKKIVWDDYYAVSVSESNVDDVRKYIRGQDRYHAQKSLDEELGEFYRRYGWRKPATAEKKDEVAGSVDTWE